MGPLFERSFGLLAKGDWSDLLGVIVLVAVYAVGALVKMVSNRSSSTTDEAVSKSKVLELAKKYTRERRSQSERQRIAPARRASDLTEWDRQQELKRRQLARLNEQEQKHATGPVSVPIIQKIEHAPPPPIQAISTPEYIPAATPQKTQIYQRFMEAAQQRQSTPKPQRSKMPKPVRYAEKPAAAAEVAKTVRTLDSLLKNPTDLRAAIILKEILDKPIGLREDW